MAAELAEATKNFNQGRFEDARRICDRILVEDPDNIGVLNVLGGSLARSGKIAQAIQVAEKVCFLSPGDAVFFSNLSYLHSLLGHFPQAMLVMAHAVVRDPVNTVYQTKFARLIDHMEFYKLTADTGVIKEAIGICLGNPDRDAGSFSTAWHSLLLLDPVFIKLATSTEDGDFEEQAEEVSIDELAEPLSDPFLLLGIKSLHAVDAKLERVMTFLRHLFLSCFDDHESEPFLPFLCALAEHCLLNEYVYSVTEQEQLAVDALEAKLDLSLTPDVDDKARIALIYCYRDSMQLDQAGIVEEANTDSQNDAFLHLIKNIVSIPTISRAHSDAISAVLPSPDSGQNTVSSSVARQYEENPYPRWRHLDIPVLTEKLRTKGRGKKILVAGCGTGYEPLNLATHYPEAQILGIDLSVPSLAYGKQKAVEFGIDNVEFMRADILELEGLGRQFDLVTSVGVLHHMENPVEGWRKLLTCLKPDGIMKIGLYSEAARQSVALCKNWIEEQGFKSTPEGIRDFRQSIMDMDAENPIRDIMNWTDFYSMSMCRDLVFHVQEQFVTLPWIKSVLNDLHLCCLFMRISNPLFKKEYRSMYTADPELKNLDSLHKYEMHNPDTFRDMYQFWCCRKGSETAKRPPAWFYTVGQ